VSRLGVSYVLATRYGRDVADLNALAQQFLALHEGPTLVLPNAWDAGSAAIIESAGAAAIATTSGGVSWALGRSDGEALRREDALTAVARVVRAVSVPVTADVEAGYGDVEATIAGVIRAGAVGVNLEDSRGGKVISAQEQAAQYALAREVANVAGVPDFVINARTDIYLFGYGAPETRFDEVVARAEVYAEAGASVLFVPGLLDLPVLEALSKASPLPLAVMAGPGGPTIAQLSDVGVRRVSIGTGLAQIAYTTALRAAQEMLNEGTYTSFEGAIDYGMINSLFR
jgi:2-methylisocitrate lyase-like PEP mutase family enzyme